MPGYIVKPDPDVDFYVRWSTVVDAPTAWGPRAWFEKEFAGDSEVAPDRFERADATGSSALWPNEAAPVFGWQDDDFTVMEIDLPGGRKLGGWYRLPRASLRELCDRLEADADPTDLLLWEPFE
jgi:hypothetical protein